jgi:hypothetical protein
LENDMPWPILILGAAKAAHAVATSLGAKAAVGAAKGATLKTGVAKGAAAKSAAGKGSSEVGLPPGASKIAKDLAKEAAEKVIDARAERNREHEKRKR